MTNDRVAKGSGVWDVTEQLWVGPRNLMNERQINCSHAGIRQGHLGRDMVVAWTFLH